MEVPTGSDDLTQLCLVDRDNVEETRSRIAAAEKRLILGRCSGPDLKDSLPSPRR